jgi:putative transcriptional regulator
MIEIKLKEILEKKKLTRYRLSMITGIRMNTLTALYNEESIDISFDNIEKICKALECDIADLFKIVPGERPKKEKKLKSFKFKEGEEFRNK